MIQEEIARLTGTLKFNVDARPLITFEKRLERVTQQLQQFSQIANKKFQVKVSLDSRTLRAQLEKAANAKVVFKNFSVSEEAIAGIAAKLANRLDDTPIRLKNVKIDIGGLVAQKKFMRTSLGNMESILNVRMRGNDAELRKWIKDVEAKTKIRLRVELIEAQFVSSLKKAIRNASLKVGAVKVKVADPEVKLKVDRQHLAAQLRDAISQHEYQIRVRVNNAPGGTGGAHPRAAARAAAGGGLAGAGLATAGMGFARGALPGLGAAWAIGQINSINQELVASTNALKAVSDSAEGFESNMKFLEDISQEQGRLMRDVAPAFTSVLASAGASIGNQGTQDLFRGVMKYSTVMGLDQEAMKGTFRAIGQMFSKDKIQAEEAQGQLAERLPAAMQLLAQANGTSVKELREQMQKGELDPKKVLPEMAKIMEALAEKNGSYARALESTRVQQGRMNRQFERTVKVFSDAGFDQGMGRFFKLMADGMIKGEPMIKALGEAFKYLIEPLNALINVVATFGNALVKIGEAAGLTGGEFYALGAVFLALTGPLGMIVTAIGLLSLALDDLIIYAEGGDSLFGRWVKDAPGAQAAVDSLSKEAKTFADNIALAFGATRDLNGELKGLSFNEMFVATIKELGAILKLFNDTVDRFVNAGQFAKDFGGDSTLEQNLRNMQGIFMGKEWTDQFRDRQITASMMDPKNIIASDVPGRQSLTPENLASAVAEAIAKVQQESAVSGAMQVSVEVPINVQGMLSAGDLEATLKAPIQKIAEDAFSGAISRAQARQKDIK